MSGSITVDEGLNNLAIFGVKGGVTHVAGQSERPVSFATSGGNGSGTPVPLEGNLNDVCSVGASSCAMTRNAKDNNNTTRPFDNILSSRSVNWVSRVLKLYRAAWKEVVKWYIKGSRETANILSRGWRNYPTGHGVEIRALTK